MHGDILNAWLLPAVLILFKWLLRFGQSDARHDVPDSRSVCFPIRIEDIVIGKAIPYLPVMVQGSNVASQEFVKLSDFCFFADDAINSESK